jgi:hypothetical protein
MKMHRKVGLGTLFAVIAASAVLAAPVGAAKAPVTVSCSPTGATITYPSGTAVVVALFGSITGGGVRVVETLVSPARAGSIELSASPDEILTALARSNSGKTLGDTPSDSCF